MKYNTNIRIPHALHTLMLLDLKRPHNFAYERVGFLFAKTKRIDAKTLLVIAISYKSVDDEDYVKDRSVGAKINSTAIRKAMQGTLDNESGGFHVHLHNHRGTPAPSSTDSKYLPGIVQSLSNVSPKHVNGFLILSEDGFYAEMKIEGVKKLISPYKVSKIGYPMSLQIENSSKFTSAVNDRQSFLGDKSQLLFEHIRVGIIGFGGGGSHIGQQLAHIGIKHIAVFDDDTVELTNLNRLVGAWFTDVRNKILKTEVARRLIKKILPTAIVDRVNSKWQMSPEKLQNCDVIFGCIDSYNERQQLEAECRRYLIPLIDIGMDVHKTEGYSISGQVILSLPGFCCMNCYGYLTPDKLAKEAAKYGKVGGRPQVVWPNGVLASSAVGVFVDLITGWSEEKNKLIYLEYDGNSGLIRDHPRKTYAAKECSHFKLIEAGPVVYKRI